MVGGLKSDLLKSVHVSWDDCHSGSFPQLSGHDTGFVVHTKVIREDTYDTMSEAWVNDNGTVIKVDNSPQIG